MPVLQPLELQNFSMTLAFCCLLISVDAAADAATAPRTNRSVTNDAKQNEASKLQSPIHYADRYYVPEDLLQRKGGVSQSVKEAAMRKGLVYISSPLAQSDSSIVGVCESIKPNKAFGFVACPTVDAAKSDTFCCGDAPTQYCCSRDEFYRIRGRQISTREVAQRIVVLVLGLAGSLLFSGCLCLIVCLCIVLPKWRKRTAVRALRHGEARRSLSGAGTSRSAAAASSTGSQRAHAQTPPQVTQHTLLLRYPVQPKYSLQQQPPQPPQEQKPPRPMQPPPPYSPPAGSDVTN